MSSSTWLQAIAVWCGVVLTMSQTQDPEDLYGNITTFPSNYTTETTAGKHPRKGFAQEHPHDFYALLGGIAVAAFAGAVITIHYKSKPKFLPYKYNAEMNEYTCLVPASQFSDYDTIQITSKTVTKVPEGWTKPENCDWETQF